MKKDGLGRLFLPCSVQKRGGGAGLGSALRPDAQKAARPGGTGRWGASKLIFERGSDMNQTAAHGLSQWEAQDRILREDFNADNFKIEQALGALAETQRQTAEALAEAQSALAALRETRHYVKLADYTTTEASKQFDLDVSQIDFTQYFKIELSLETTLTNDAIRVLTNGATSGYTGFSSGNSYSPGQLVNFSAPSGYNQRLSCILQFNAPQAGAAIRCIYMGSTAIETCYAPVQWQNLRTLNFTSQYTIPAGTRVILMGVAK